MIFIFKKSWQNCDLLTHDVIAVVVCIGRIGMLRMSVGNFSVTSCSASIFGHKIKPLNNNTLVFKDLHSKKKRNSDARGSLSYIDCDRNHERIRRAVGCRRSTPIEERVYALVEAFGDRLF